MAKISSVTNSVFDTLFQTCTEPESAKMPVWDEDQKMFISDEFISASGNHYYKGIRFSDRFSVVEKLVLYHSWTYIDEIEVYSYDGDKATLIGSHKFTKEFHKPEIIREETEKIVADYLISQCKFNNMPVKKDEITSQAKAIVDKSYQSFLNDDYSLDKDYMSLLLKD